jgi:hypothetical protein
VIPVAVESRLKANPNPEPNNERWNAVASGPRSSEPFPRSTAMISEERDASTDVPQRSRGHIWGRRIFMVVLVLFCIELGMALVVLPWLSVWTENSLLRSYPQLRSFMAQYFVRGAFTGLGLIDIWIGVWEAVHYRDVPVP